MKPSPATNRARLLVALLAALVVAAVLGACGTVLDIAPDPPLGDEAGGSGDAASDGATTPDGSDVDIDIDGSITCPISADRVTIDMGEVLAGFSRVETVSLTSTSADPQMVSVVVSGDVGFHLVPPSSFLVSGAGATFDVQFDALAFAAGKVAGHVAITYPGCAVPIGIDLFATRSNAPYGVTPGIVNLGAAACGSTPKPTTLTIVAGDAGSPTAPWSIPAVAPFFPAPTSGTLAGGTSDITISMPALPLAPLGQIDRNFTLTIAGTPRIVPATVLSRGSIIQFSTSSVTITPALHATVSVKNVGNLDMDVLFTAPGISVAPNKAFQLVAGGQPKPLLLSVATVSVPTTTVTATAGGPGTICSFGTLTVTVSSK